MKRIAYTSALALTFAFSFKGKGQVLVIMFRASLVMQFCEKHNVFTLLKCINVHSARAMTPPAFAKWIVNESRFYQPVRSARLYLNRCDILRIKARVLKVYTERREKYG